jgi:hypothetical protein
MIHDPLGSEKTLRNSDEVVQKLIELRDDLWRCRKVLSFPETMIAFKINSCLYQPKERS